MIKDTIDKFEKNNSEEVLRLEKSIFNGLSSLIYPEYIKNFIKVNNTTTIVPSILSIDRLFRSERRLVQFLSTELFNKIKDNDFIKCMNIFNDANINMTEFIVDIKVNKAIINVQKTIIRKFNLDSEIIGIYKKDIRIFENDFQDYHLDYLINQILLNLSVLNGNYKTFISIKDEDRFNLGFDDVLMVDHRCSNGPIFINKDIINNPYFKTISYVTNTYITENENGYNIESNKNNILYIIKKDDL